MDARAKTAGHRFQILLRFIVGNISICYLALVFNSSPYTANMTVETPTNEHLFEEEGVLVTTTHVYGPDCSYGLRNVQDVRILTYTVRSVCETRRATRSLVVMATIVLGTIITMQGRLEPLTLAGLVLVISGVYAVWFWRRYIEHRTVNTVCLDLKGENWFLCVPSNPSRAEEIRDVILRAVRTQGRA